MQNYPEHLRALTPLQKMQLIKGIRTFMREYNNWAGSSVFSTTPAILPETGRTSDGLVLRYWGNCPYQLHTPWGVWPFGGNKHPRPDDENGLLRRVLRIEWLSRDDRNDQCAILAINGLPLPRPTLIPDAGAFDDLGCVTDEFMRLVGYDPRTRRWVR
jgi:hypothetical protein